MPLHRNEAVTGQKKPHDIEADFSARVRLMRVLGAAGISPLRRPRPALRPTPAFTEGVEPSAVDRSDDPPLARCAAPKMLIWALDW